MPAHGHARRRLLAGVLTYRCGPVVHAQYTASGDEGRRLRMLPALYAAIADAYSDSCSWLDIGTSCEDAGRILNAGLDSQKAGLGGRCTVYASYTISL